MATIRTLPKEITIYVCDCGAYSLADNDPDLGFACPFCGNEDKLDPIQMHLASDLGDAAKIMADIVDWWDETTSYMEARFATLMGDYAPVNRMRDLLKRIAGDQ